MADSFKPALRVRSPMCRSRTDDLRYDRIVIVGLLMTVTMFAAGSVLGARVMTKRGHVRDPGLAHVRTTYAVAHDVATRIVDSLHGNRCPADLGHPIDPWGNGYVIVCADRAIVISAGPDGRIGTDDDVTVTR